MSLSDSSLFIYKKEGIQAFLLVYVDDLILTGSVPIILKSFMKKLSNQFSIKYLGYPHYFLGVELIPTSDGLILAQHGHIRNFLQPFDMSKTHSHSSLQFHPPSTSGRIYTS